MNRVLGCHCTRNPVAPCLFSFVVLLFISGLVVRRLLRVVDLLAGQDKVVRRPCLESDERPKVAGRLTRTEVRGRRESPAGGDSYVVDGVLQVQDTVFERVADVVFGIAGGGHLLIEGAFHQLLVLQHEEMKATQRSESIEQRKLSRDPLPKLPGIQPRANFLTMGCKPGQRWLVSCWRKNRSLGICRKQIPCFNVNQIMTETIQQNQSL